MKNPPPLFWPSAVFSCGGWMAPAAYNGPTDGREEENTKSYSVKEKSSRPGKRQFFFTRIRFQPKYIYLKKYA